MADAVNIDWGQLKQPDPLGDYQSAFAAGRALGARQSNVGTNPGLSGQPAAPPNPQPPSIQDHIASMTEDQRLAAGRAQEQFAAILKGLQMQTRDPAERLAMARHLASLHPEFGIDPNAINADDVSDPGLERHIETSLRLKAQLQGSNADPPFQGTASANPTMGHALSDADLIAALRLHGVQGIDPADRANALSAPPPLSPHTLSDHDLKSILEF